MSDEQGYLDLCTRVMSTGFRDENERTGAGTIGTFGEKLTFDLSNNKLPLFTTKKLTVEYIIKELDFFISGKTDTTVLSDHGVPIWSWNTSREWLDHHGLQHYRTGEYGPLYGFQWRHFGAEYRGPDADYTDKGVDQLARIIDGIKLNPSSRRHVMSAWSPGQLHEMALPPCHITYICGVRGTALSAMVVQRSADLALGVPYNVASYALLTHLIAHICGLQAETLVHVMANTHVYLPHVPSLQTQCQRVPGPAPTVTVTGDLDNHTFTVAGYNPQPFVRFGFVV